MRYQKQQRAWSAGKKGVWKAYETKCDVVVKSKERDKKDWEASCVQNLKEKMWFKKK